MKKTASLIFILALPVSLTAQVDIAGESVKRVKHSVEVAFDIHTTPKTLKNRYKMVLTPYLCNGADTVWLPQAEIYGKIRYKRERQEQALSGNRTWSLAPNQILEGGSCTYAAAVPYETWMRTASLGIKRRMVGCACDCHDGDQTLLADVPVYTPPVPAVAEIAADPARFEVVEAHRRWAFDRNEIRVFFPVADTELYPDKFGNQATLDKIVEGIRKIGSTEKLRLSGVEITGFASPEGALALNTRLGGERARALKTYIAKAVPELCDADFQLINGVENWDDLRRMVAASDMECRDEVLAVLDNDAGNDRKVALQRLAGGKPYRYMLKNFYPELRNACYVAVYYDVLNDVAADAINAANTQIRAGKYAEALELLREYGDDPRAWNPIGVCHMMLEEEDEAVRWFEKAVAAGCVEARKNMEQIR